MLFLIKRDLNSVELEGQDNSKQLDTLFEVNFVEMKYAWRHHTTQHSAAKVLFLFFSRISLCLWNLQPWIQLRCLLLQFY